MAQAGSVSEQIIAAFKKSDKRNTGVVSVWKLKEICRLIGNDEETVTDALHAYRDSCGNSCSGVDYTTFVTWMMEGDGSDDDEDETEQSEETLQRKVAKKMTKMSSGKGSKTAQSEKLSKSNLWGKVKTKSGLTRFSLGAVALEAKIATESGASLESSAHHHQELTPDELVRSFSRFTPALYHHWLFNSERNEAGIGNAIVKRFRMALVLIDVSGFTRMSVKLGAELTRKHTSEFFDQIIHCITFHGGDVLKFLGDALLVSWPTAYPASPELEQQIVVAAATCAAEVMRSLNGYMCTEEVVLTLHGGIALGDVYAFDVGNEKRREFLIGGTVLSEIGDMESEATSGQLVISQQVADFLPKTATLMVTETGHVRLDLDAIEKATDVMTNMVSDNLDLQFGTLGDEEQDKRMLQVLMPFEKHLEAHVPPSCREFVHESMLEELGEMRHVTTMFLALDALVPHLNKGNAALVQKSFLIALEAVKFTGGAVRQFVLDDKGCVVIMAWGLHHAAHGHGQDASRAIQCAFQILHGLHDVFVPAESPGDASPSRPKVVGPHIGIASGEVYVGLIGAPQRCEYAMVGPSVNLSARLMGKAGPWQVLVEENVRNSAGEADNSWVFHSHPPVQAKGYDKNVSVFVPEQEAGRPHLAAQLNLLDEFAEVWSNMDLQVQMVGKVASVLADGPDGHSIDFSLSTLVSAVDKLKLANYAEAKSAMNQLEETRFFRRAGGVRRGKPCYAFAVDSVHKWVFSLLTAEYAAKVRGLVANCERRAS